MCAAEIIFERPEFGERGMTLSTGAVSVRDNVFRAEACVGAHLACGEDALLDEFHQRRTRDVQHSAAVLVVSSLGMDPMVTVAPRAMVSKPPAQH